MRHLTLNRRAVSAGLFLLIMAAGIAAPYAVSRAQDRDRGTVASGEPRIAGATSLTDAGGDNVQVNAAVATTTLVRGWNNVAFLGPDAAPAAALAEISGKYDAVYRWNPAAKQYRLYGPGLPAFMNTLTSIGFGDGIWIFLTAETAQLTAVVGDGGANYTAGPGLQLTGAQFSVQFLAANAVNGTATSVARSDHTHFGQTWSGDSSGGSGLRVENAGAFGYGVMGKTGDAIGILGYGTIATAGLLSSSGCGPAPLINVSAGIFGSTCLPSAVSDGVRGYSEAGAGVRGAGPKTGVLGESTGLNGTGVTGSSVTGGADGIGVYGYAGAAAPTRPSTTGVYGYGDGGVGVYGRSNGTGSVGVKGLSDGTNSLAGQFIGPISASSCSGCNLPSDRRLKRDIAPSERGLGEILRLQSVSFAYNEDIYGPGPHIGFLAQDVQGILPELVEKMENGFLRIDYDEVIPVLTKAIQEQQAQIEALRSQVSGSQPPASTANAGAAQSSLNDWAMPGAVVFFGLGLFALAGVQLRRKSEPRA